LRAEDSDVAHGRVHSRGVAHQEENAVCDLTRLFQGHGEAKNCAEQEQVRIGSNPVVEDIVGKDGALIAARDESAVRRPQKERAPGRGRKATKRTDNRGSSKGAKRAKNMGLTRETTIPPTRDMDMRMSRKTKSVVLD